MENKLSQEELNQKIDSFPPITMCEWVDEEWLKMFGNNLHIVKTAERWARLMEYEMLPNDQLTKEVFDSTCHLLQQEIINVGYEEILQYLINVWIHTDELRIITRWPYETE